MPLLDDKGPSQNPITFLLDICIALLICAMALTLAVNLLATIWPWLLGAGALAVSIWAAVAIARHKRSRW